MEVQSMEVELALGFAPRDFGPISQIITLRREFILNVHVQFFLH